ncbi:MAG: CPBP family intramembrane glutamic endopeptidase [Armatimonadota bacterium]
MEENLELPDNEQVQPEVYPKRRFTIIFSVIIALLVLMTIADRLLTPKDQDKTASIDAVLQADYLVKSTYALRQFESFMPQGSQVESNKASERNLRLATVEYRKAVKQTLLPVYIRRLILLEEPERRDGVIQLLDKASGNNKLKPSERAGLPDEAAMWRSIYFFNDPLSSDEVDKYSARIRKLHLGWYQHLALADLYDRSAVPNAASFAARERTEATRKAAWNIGWLIALGMVILLMGLAGVVLLIIYAVILKRRRSRRIPGPGSVIISMPNHIRSFAAGYLLEAFLAYILIMLGVQVVIGVIIMIIIGDLDKLSSIMSTIVNFVAYVLSGGLALLYLTNRLKSVGLSFSHIGLKSRNIAADIGWGIAGYASALPLLLITVIITTYLEKYIPTPPNPMVPELLESNSIFARVLLFSMLSIGAPFFEEIFFRGALLNSLRSKWGTLAGIMISAAIFAFVHPFPLSFLPIFVLGTVFAVLSYERQSLIPSMIMHFINNTGIFIVLMLTTG